MLLRCVSSSQQLAAHQPTKIEIYVNSLFKNSVAEATLIHWVGGLNITQIIKIPFHKNFFKYKFKNEQRIKPTAFSKLLSEAKRSDRHSNDCIGK